MPAVLVDLGGTYLRLGLWREYREPEILLRSRIRNFADGTAAVWQEVVSSIADFASAVSHLLPAAAPVIISFPGPVLNRSRILDAPTVAGASSAFPDLRSTLARQTGREVHILNDVSAAAWHMSRRVNAKRFMVVTISSGIGSKVFDRDHALGVLDDVTYAGEIGHARVDESADAPICDCGGRGHLGAIASGRGILRRARQMAFADPAFADSLCARAFSSSADALTNEQHLVPAARLGDAWVLGIVRECTATLAQVLLQNVMAAGVERVVVIGGFALSLGETYKAILQDEMVKRCDYRVLAEHLKDLIVMGEQDACLLGTAAYASRFCSA